MATGIYNMGMFGREEVPQKDIDFWCDMCQFPLNPDSRCTDKDMIQSCWSETGAVAGVWHILHECPFIHQTQECRCNDYKTIREAFKAAGRAYIES